MTAPTTLSAKDVADKLDTDAKTLRVFLRAASIPKDEATNRYVFTAKDLPKLKKQFKEWREARIATTANHPMQNEEPAAARIAGHELSGAQHAYAAEHLIEEARSRKTSVSKLPNTIIHNVIEDALLEADDSDMSK
ncbi:hypothetical protein [Nocardia fluminea]|uniref:hypothetical protein n=1 Tax=Nocardia fluminea TaxID=134984 RepID=UPI003410DB99